METKNTELFNCVECNKEFKRRVKGSRASRLQANVLGAGRKTCCNACSRKYKNRARSSNTKSGLCANCKRPILTCVAYPYVLCDGNNNKYCMACAKVKATEFLTMMKNRKEVL